MLWLYFIQKLSRTAVLLYCISFAITLDGEEDSKVGNSFVITWDGEEDSKVGNSLDITWDGEEDSKVGNSAHELHKHLQVDEPYL